MSFARTSTQALRLRAAPAVRSNLRTRGTGYRFNSSNAGPNAQANMHPAVAGAAAGAGAAVLIGYGAYKYTGIDKAVETYTTTKSYFNSATDKLKQATPEPNQALEALRSQAYHYAAFVPGGRGYVDTAFKDIDAIREKHGEEVNAIVSDSYSQLKKVAEEKGFSLDAASRSWEILQSSLSKITDLAGDAADQILDNHPKLKEQVGGSFTQLKQMGEQYGPEAKKQVDDVYKQVTEIVKGGVSFDTVSKIKQLVESKQKDLAKFGDAAWNKGLETAKPYLDKTPQIKELVEKNADALKSGDMAQLWEKIKGGDAGDIESFVKSAADQAKNKANQATGGGLDKYLSMLPGLGAIGPHLSKLKEVADHKGDDAKDLLEKTYKDIEEVLKKRVGEAEKLANETKKEATK